MRTEEFREYCLSHGMSADTAGRCLELCREVEEVIGWDLDDVVKTPWMIKVTLECAMRKGRRYFAATEQYYAFAFPVTQCRIPLFHGTRRYSIEVDKGERERFFAACKTVISFAKRWMDGGNVDWESIKEYRTENRLYMDVTVLSQYGSPSYQYGDFYLTSSYTNALIFANRGAGELGDYAYAQARGFAHFGIPLDEDTLAAAGIVEAEYPKYAESERLVLIYYGVMFEDLYTERGGSYMTRMDRRCKDGEYAEFLEAHLYDGHKDTDNICMNNNFRLKNREHYFPLELEGPKFKAGFSVFTAVKDVDKYLRYKRIEQYV